MRWADNPHYDDALREIVAQGSGASWDEIAATLTSTLGVPFTGDQVSARARRMGLERPTPTAVLAAAVSNERSRALRPAERREATAALRDQARWEDFLDIVRGELLVPPADQRPPATTPAGPGTPETMCLVVSDIHIGKLVEKDVTGPGFGYDQSVFAARQAELLNAVLRLRDIHSQHGPIPKLILFFVGDGVDGVDMRRGHAHRVDIQTATAQTIRLAQFFAWLLRSLAPWFPEGIDLNWEFGNHGRVGEFGVNLPSDNWDYLAGVMVRENVADLPAVRVNVHTQQYGIYRIGPLVAYAEHGNSIRGGGGSPAVKRHVASLQNLHRMVFDLVLMGHFHTSEYLTAGGAKVFMNGAWDGGDDFSVNQLVAASDPAQWAFGVHPRRGLTWMYEIALAPRRRSTPVLS